MKKINIIEIKMSTNGNTDNTAATMVTRTIDSERFFCGLKSSEHGKKAAPLKENSEMRPRERAIWR